MDLRLMKKIALLLLTLLALVGCATRPVRAQFIGYTAPQTEQQTLATSTLCTGSAQTYAINNLGQTQHWLSVANVTGATKFQAELDAFDVQGNTYRISDVMEIPGLVATRQGTLYATGYFPKIQATITCSPGTATFTASYAGGWGTTNGAAGSFLTAQIDKVNFAQIAGNAPQTDTFQTPFGSSAGAIFFQYSGSVAGGTLAVVCNTNGTTGNSNLALFTLANVSLLQVFTVPDYGCPFVTLNYTNGGAATSITSDYVFAVPGLRNHATTDMCSSGTFPKSGTAVSAGAATTTQIIAAVAQFAIYVCGYELSQIATAGTVQWVYGTGASCGTGTTNLTGPMGVTASQPFGYGTGGNTVFKVPVGNALCLTATGAGGTVSGVVTAIQLTQ